MPTIIINQSLQVFYSRPSKIAHHKRDHKKAMENNNNLGNSFRCNRCPKVSSIIMIFNSLFYFIFICLFQVFKSAKTLRNHKARHDDNLYNPKGMNRFVCRICHQVFFPNTKNLYKYVYFFIFSFFRHIVILFTLCCDHLTAIIAQM